MFNYEHLKLWEVKKTFNFPVFISTFTSGTDINIHFKCFDLKIVQMVIVYDLELHCLTAYSSVGHCRWLTAFKY